MHSLLQPITCPCVFKIRLAFAKGLLCFGFFFGRTRTRTQGRANKQSLTVNKSNSRP